MVRTVAVVVFVAWAGSAAVGSYTVRPGDTLSAIATRTGVPVGALASANGITDPNLIFAGSRLVVPEKGATAPTAPAAGSTAAAPSGRTHVVQAGDTLARIARRYGVDQSALAAANGIANPNLIRLGVTLTVPGGGPAPAAPASASSLARLPVRLQARPDRLALLPHFDAWAGAYGVPADLLKAMTWLESGWQHHVVSPVGAVGIGQLMPSTTAFVNGLLGTTLDPELPADNIRLSARFLRFLLDQTGGNVEQALAGYYQGLGSVRSRGMYPVTQGYVAAVLSLRPRF